jgi:hypothetical protein
LLTVLTGHFYLTTLLLPILLSTAQSDSNAEKKVRVVNVSSFTHILSPALDFEALKDGKGRNKYSTTDLYNLSKLVRILPLASAFPDLLVSLFRVIFSLLKSLPDVMGMRELYQPLSTLA